MSISHTSPVCLAAVGLAAVGFLAAVRFIAAVRLMAAAATSTRTGKADARVLLGESVLSVEG